MSQSWLGVEIVFTVITTLEFKSCYKIVIGCVSITDQYQKRCIWYWHSVSSSKNPSFVLLWIRDNKSYAT